MIQQTSQQADTWLTIKLLSEVEPSFSQSAIRNLIFKAADRESSLGTIQGNGLAPHIRRIGRKVLINRVGFREWIERGGK